VLGDSRRVLMLLVWCLLFFAAGIGVVLANDFEYRMKAENVAGMGEDWKATLSFESRYVDKREQVHQHTDVGAVYIGLARWFDVGLRYRTVFSREDETDWNRENRYYIDMTARHAFYDVGLSHRVRLEYNSRDVGLDDFGTIRYRIAVNPPHALSRERERRVLKNYQYRPYANYELTANSFDEGVTRHAFELGISIEVLESLLANLYYMYEENRSELQPENLNVVGLVLKALL
jgi:hypothetical protein